MYRSKVQRIVFGYKKGDKVQQSFLYFNIITIHFSIFQDNELVYSKKYFEFLFLKSFITAKISSCIFLLLPFKTLQFPEIKSLTLQSRD